MKIKIFAFLMAFCFRAHGQNKENPVFISNGVQTVNIDFKINIYGGVIQPYYIKYAYDYSNVSVYETNIIDSTLQNNPFPQEYISLYTSGDCLNASSLNSWAWGTFKSNGDCWIEVSCQKCLINCFDRNGDQIACRCFRLIPKKIENFNPLPVVINPVVKTVYRA